MWITVHLRKYLSKTIFYTQSLSENRNVWTKWHSVTAPERPACIRHLSGQLVYILAVRLLSIVKFKVTLDLE